MSQETKRKNFAERTIDCSDCTVDEDTAIEVMDRVALGTTEPEEHWCLRHRARFQKETRDYMESDEITTLSRPGGAGKCPQGCRHPVAGRNTMETVEETVPVDPPEFQEVYGEVITISERTRVYQECIVCGWGIDI